MAKIDADKVNTLVDKLDEETLDKLLDVVNKDETTSKDENVDLKALVNQMDVIVKHLTSEKTPEKKSTLSEDRQREILKIAKRR